MSTLQIIEANNVNVIESQNDKWQKLVVYYLSRLKGLCDWRNNTATKLQKNKKMQLRRCTSQELETRMIDNITQKPSRKTNPFNENDIGCYIVAGYEEGKQQAVKIITRSLKYGVMTGILTKKGNAYRIAPEFLYVCETKAKKQKPKQIKKHKQHCRKCSVNSVKTNIRKKRTVQIDGKPTKIKAKTKNKPKKKNTLKHSKYCCNYESDEKPPNKRNKRSSDTKINVKESSSSTFGTISRSLTPIDDRKDKRDVRAKRPRPKIQNPINYVPPRKKPRTQSQSRSPSHHTDDDEVMDIGAKGLIINKFSMPRPRRFSNVMSSMSSSSLGSCKRCECDAHIDQMIKKTRRK